MTLRSLATASALVSGGLLFGRLIGLLREMLLASVFGAGSDADMAVLLLIIPDFITGALLGGALSATLVPAFSAHTREDAIRLMWQVLLLSVVALSLVALVLFAIERAGDLGQGRLSGWQVVLFLTALPLTAITAILSSWLQFRSRFLVIALSNAIFNAVVIAALGLLPASLAVLAAAVAAAALVRMAAHIVAYRNAEGALPFAGRSPWLVDRALLRHYATTATTGMVSMVPHYVPYAIIAAMGGGVAVFNYAFKLIIMPATLGQGVVQMVLLPWLLGLRGNAQHDSRASQSDSLQLAWLVSLSLCLGLTLASRDIAHLFFGYGKMTAADVSAVADMFAIGVWAVPGMWLASVWQQCMYAVGNARAPLLSNVLLAVLVVVACVVGQWMGSLHHLAFLYALVQMAPVLWLAREAVRSGMMKGYVPSHAYARMALLCLAAWVPLALIKTMLGLSPLYGLAYCVVAGALTLAAGAWGFTPLRQVLLSRFAG